MNQPADTPFECIDPRVGSQLWRLEDPSTTGALRSEIEAHLGLCHACRLVLQLDEAARKLAGATLLGSDQPMRSQPVRRRRLTRAAWWTGLPLAACLVATLSLPPRPTQSGGASRGADSASFQRPVEGEVIATSRPSMSWTPIAGASRYEIEIRDHEGRSIWRGESTRPSLRMDEHAELARNQEYRAILSVQPSDLLPPGRTSVAFRTGSFAESLVHRMRWAHPALQAASVLAATLFVTALFLRRRA